MAAKRAAAKKATTKRTTTRKVRPAPSPPAAEEPQAPPQPEPEPAAPPEPEVDHTIPKPLEPPEDTQRVGLEGAILHRASMLFAKAEASARRHPGGQHPPRKYLEQAARDIFKQEGADRKFAWRIVEPRTEFGLPRVAVEAKS